MKTYLESVSERLANETPTVLVWELETAFAEAMAAKPAFATPEVRALHDLMRFCKFDAIAPWLRDERDAVQRALDFARRIGDAKVAQLLDDALAGKPQGKPKFSLTLPGKAPQDLIVDAGEATRFAGLDWGGTDLALSFAMDGFIEAVVREVVARAADLDLQAPLAKRKRAEIDRVIDAQAGQASAAALFEKLVSARNPIMEAGTWEAWEERRTEGNLLIEVTHNINLPATPEDLAAAEKRFGTVARDLLAMYALHDGAELFVHEGNCGFYLAPMDEWKDLLENATDWAENVTWGGEPEEIPRHLYSAIAFGMIPGDSERWLLITEGEHAGKVMLSDTDLIEDSPRFESIGQFMSTLINDAGRVLNSGGHVRYLVDDENLFPVRYSEG